MGVEFNRFCSGVDARGTLGGSSEGGVEGVEEDLLAGLGEEVKAISVVAVKCQNDAQRNSTSIRA